MRTKSIFSIKTVCYVALAMAIALPAVAANKGTTPLTRPLEVPDDSYPPQPAFFVVKDNDSILYIFGSMHKVRKHTKWFTPQMRQAFFDADKIWFEITQEDASHPILQVKSMREGEAEEGRTLNKILTPEEYDRVTKAANSVGLEMSSLDQMKPWLVGDVLRGTFQAKVDEKKYNDGDSPVKSISDPDKDRKEASSGQSTSTSTENKPLKRPPAMQGGVEDILSLMAVGRPMLSIENVEKHIMLFDNLSEETQRSYLMNAIDEMEDKTEEMRAMAKAWRRGNLAQIGEIDVAKLKKSNDSFYDAMLKSRNAEMTDRAETILKGSGTDFFVVGAAHLAGPDSVLEMLIARGYQPIRLYDTRPPVAMFDPNRDVDLPLYHVAPEEMPKLQVQLLPPLADKPELARLRLMANYVTHGCGEYLPLLYKIRSDGNIFEIRTAGGTIFINPRQDPSSCGPASKVPYVDIPLNIKDLQTNKVSTLWLLRGGGLDKFDVEITDDTLTLTAPEKLRYFKTKTHAPMVVDLPKATATANSSPADKKTGVVVANTTANEVVLVLEDGSIKIDAAVEKLIDQLAESRNFKATEKPGHYIDVGGQFMLHLRHTDGVRIGTITLADGRKIPVMARQP